MFLTVAEVAFCFAQVFTRLKTMYYSQMFQVFLQHLNMFPVCLGPDRSKSLYFFSLNSSSMGLSLSTEMHFWVLQLSETWPHIMFKLSLKWHRIHTHLWWLIKRYRNESSQGFTCKEEKAEENNQEIFRD